MVIAQTRESFINITCAHNILYTVCPIITIALLEINLVFFRKKMLMSIGFHRNTSVQFEKLF